MLILHSNIFPSFHDSITFSKSIHRHLNSLLLMCWHNVLFRLSVLISRLPSLCSEDDVNTLHFLVRCWITLSQCLFAASKEDPLSRLPLEHLIIPKVILGWKVKLKEGGIRKILCKTKVLKCWVQIVRFQCLCWIPNETLLFFPISQNWNWI